MKLSEINNADPKLKVEICDESKATRILGDMRADGAVRLHVLADFDSTLTRAFIDGRHVGSTNTAFRRANIFGDVFNERYVAYYEEYHPRELDPDLTREEKSTFMREWWSKVFSLQMGCGLTREHIITSARAMGDCLRPGMTELMVLLKKYEIPLAIMSAGLGDMIEIILREHAAWYDQIHVIGNRYLFDATGKVIGIRQPIIHPFNKNDVTLHDLPDYAAIKERRNVILLGDSLTDPEMVIGFECDHLLKIGFLNEKVEEQREAFRTDYDIVITGDGGIEPVTEIVRQIIE